MSLNDQQKALIKDLQMNPVWGSILEDIAAMRDVPRYSPRERDEREKVSDWIYRSGIDAGIEKILGYLRYDG
jgi:hypothetical protein